MVAQLHRHLGPERVAMLQALGALEEVEKQILVCKVEDGEDEMFNLEHWVETEIELTLDPGCCEHVLDLHDADTLPSSRNRLARSAANASLLASAKGCRMKV